MTEILGTKYLVPNTWYQILGTQYLVPNTWYQILGTKYLVPNTWYPILIPEEDILLILEDCVIYVNKREAHQLQRQMTKGGYHKKPRVDRQISVKNKFLQKT